MQKFVWIVAGGLMQLPLVKHLEREGFGIIVSDGDDNCVCAKAADHFVKIDTFDVEGHIAAAKSLKSMFNIRACVTVAADCHTTVANICQLLGLPSISVKASEWCHNKYETRRILSEFGVPQPKFARAYSLSEAKGVVSQFNCVSAIKAVNSSGSRGFSLVKNAKALTKGQFLEALNAGSEDYVLVEEALTPKRGCIAEQSVETIWQDGKMYWLNWVDRLFVRDLGLFDGLKQHFPSELPDGVEIGHLNPAVHEPTIVKLTQSVAKDAGIALGLNLEKYPVVLKLDIMQTDAGPIILECTPRLSGGWDSSGTSKQRGADLQRGIVALALGDQLSLDIWNEYFRFDLGGQHYSAVLTEIDQGATNCIGRRFFMGSGKTRMESISECLKRLESGIYVL